MVEKFDINDLLKYDRIMFGPFLGELGWEIRRWSGFVRWFKKTYPNKVVHAATRSDREDLYYGAVDDVVTIDIEGDYTKYRPNMYRLDFFPPVEKKNLISAIKSTYRSFNFYEPPITLDRNYFPLEQMDFNFTPNEDSKEIINRCVNRKFAKIPILISPRHRVDLEGENIRVRNWKMEYWFELYDLLERTKRFVVLVAGKTPSYIRPIEGKHKSFIILEDLIRPTERTSLIGLTIEAIKNVKVTVGQQSSIPVLSNLLGTPTLMWGDEDHRHKVLENPFNTKCWFFKELDANYKTDPKLICSKIIEMTDPLREKTIKKIDLEMYLNKTPGPKY